MDILVFGGTGAMGTPLVKILAEQGHNVYVTSRKSRKSENKKIHYISGNAHNMDFLNDVLKNKYDVLVDFMNYHADEFSTRVDKLLDSVGQYIFISSCRVYAPSDVPVKETSPRLLDISTDNYFLSSGEYALEKAREEDMLLNSGHKNWTIIRPRLTYNVGRQQLGTYELDDWLYRILKGGTLVFSEDLMEIYVPMTLGDDTAVILSKIAGNDKAFGEIYHITTPETMKWKDILQIYVDALDKFGCKAKIHMIQDGYGTAEVLGRKWRFKHTTSCNRSFDVTKIKQLCGENVAYTSMKVGLEKCLSDYLNSGMQIKCINWKNEAYQDKISNEHTPLSEFPSLKSRIRYLLGRYTPFLRIIVMIKRTIKK